MITTYKRGAIYHFCTYIQGRRLRGSLGTRHRDTAKGLAAQLELAVLAGPNAPVWEDLERSLPAASLRMFSHVGPTPKVTIREAEKAFDTYLSRLLAAGRLANRSLRIYEGCVRRFVDWAETQEVQLMDQITSSLLEIYVGNRRAELTQAKCYTNGASILTDLTSIKRFVEFCAEERWIAPIRLPEKPVIEGPIEGAEPFTAQELALLEANVKPADRLMLLLFRWTGMRGSDVAGLQWSEVDLMSERITKITQKRKTQVVIPLAPVLTDALKAAGPQAGQVLPGATREKLYGKISALGRKCGILNSHPHRFRATFVVHLLENQVPIFEVARMIGDNPATLSKAYARFTDGMVERVRKVLSS